MTDLYFKVAKSSPIMKVIERCKKELMAHSKGVRRFLTESGFDKKTLAWGTDTYVIGVTGKIDKPGWRYDRRQGCSVPAKLTPEGKAIEARRRAIPPSVDWRHVSEELFKHGFITGKSERGHGFCTRWAVFGWNKHGVICSMHSDVKKAATVWPKGLKEITGTQAMKYEADEK